MTTTTPTTYFYELMEITGKAECYYLIRNRRTNNIVFASPIHPNKTSAEGLAGWLTASYNNSPDQPETRIIAPAPANHNQTEEDAPQYYDAHWTRRHFDPLTYELTEEEYNDIIENW